MVDGTEGRGEGKEGTSRRIMLVDKEEMENTHPSCFPPSPPPSVSTATPRTPSSPSALSRLVSRGSLVLR